MKEVGRWIGNAVPVKLAEAVARGAGAGRDAAARRSAGGDRPAGARDGGV